MPKRKLISSLRGMHTEFGCATLSPLDAPDRMPPKNLVFLEFFQIREKRVK
jgi:hypothetical protein